MFVQRFSNGDAAPMAAEVFWAVFGPHVERPEPELDFWRARVADGGEADIYAGVAGPSLDSLLISRSPRAPSLNYWWSSSAGPGR
jgi:hypothetical protein